MKPRTLAAALSALAFSFAAVAPAQAAIVFSDVDSETSTFTMVITEEIAFTLTSSGPVFALVFEQLDPGSEGGIIGLSPLSPSPALLYTLNGDLGTDLVAGMFAVQPEFFGDTVAGDGLMLVNMGAPEFSAGDQIVLGRATYTFATDEGFDPAFFGTAFTGNVYFTDNNGFRISTDGSAVIPEPFAALLTGLGAFGLLRRRRW